ncbi:MAG: cytidylate kinase [Rhodospirillales bacterium]|nr:cytidylate kinase [Rhodospirillales bacterium]
MTLIIAIDGPAAAGKGTLARRIAAQLNLAYLDTGLIYRAVGMKALREGLAPETAAQMLGPEDLKAPNLRSEQAGQEASKVSAIPAVRSELLEFQRKFAAIPPPPAKGAVLDGRDIGTVVCPQADVKIFVTASAEARALRRHKELLERGESSIYPRVLEEMRERDERDSKRSVAPLVPAPDAVVLDTTLQDADAAFAAALAIISDRTRG